MSKLTRRDLAELVKSWRILENQYLNEAPHRSSAAREAEAMGRAAAFGRCAAALEALLEQRGEKE